MANEQPDCGDPQGRRPYFGRTRTLNADGIFSKYYLAAREKQTIDNCINQANQMQSQWLPSSGQIIYETFNREVENKGSNLVRKELRWNAAFM
ncbi:MAG: hypothetical protein II015_01585 [Aeriscardovia sp.]|nr:hypothetical protein [Aeriscardovia sp.]